MTHTPYTLQVLDAVMAAQVGIACLIFALLWFHGVGARPFFPARDWRIALLQEKSAAYLLTASLALVTTAPVLPELLKSFGASLSPLFLYNLLQLAMTFATVAAFASGRFGVLLLAAASALLLFRMPTWFPQSDGEIVALHMIVLALLVTAMRPKPTLRRAELWSREHFRDSGHHEDRDATLPAYLVSEMSNRKQDLILFLVATVVGAIVCTFVMVRRGGSADEWAYTWQAAMFAHFRAYGVAPPCGNALQTFYVFSHLGRSFVQYTPGWPLLMAPFFAIGLVWMASPVSAGVLAIGIARLCRRAAASSLDHQSPRTVTLAGWIGGLSITFGTTYLLNVGSRYAHVPTMALFAWSLEALLVLIDRPLGAKNRGWCGFALGSCVALSGATRPSDGAILELSVGAIFLWALVTKRIGWRAFLTTTLGVALWGGLSLVILRVQLGTWLTTGYSLNAEIFPWNVVRYTRPRAEEWKYSIPLSTGEYCWFPCSLAIGLAGLLPLRKAGALVSWGMTSLVPLLIYYSYVDMGARGHDWGYGPRYSLALMVPMAIGTGVALAPLAEAAMRRLADVRHDTSWHLAGPWTLACSAMIIGTVRIVPLLWPGIHDFLVSHGKVALGTARQDVHHAVVFVGKDTSEWDVLDETENLPFDIYPNPDVVFAIDRTPELTQCVKARYPGRAYYRARRGPIDITLEPF